MLNKIREIRAAKGEQGFTLIELLVVVVILVALAAIAIPVFLNQKAKADDAAAKSTVSSLASFISSGIANGSLADDDTGTPGETGAVTGTGGGQLTSSNNGTIAVPALYRASYDSATGVFCVDGPSFDPSNATGAWMYDETTGAVVEGQCP